MWWVLGAVAVAALLSAYLAWTARRVERVHVRAQSAERALAAHLLRRAAAAAVVAEHASAGVVAVPEHASAVVVEGRAASAVEESASAGAGAMADGRAARTAAGGPSSPPEAVVAPSPRPAASVASPLPGATAAPTAGASAHLVRSSGVAELVRPPAADPDVAVDYPAELYAAARLALDAEPGEREAAENGLTRTLLALPVATFPLAAEDPAMRSLIATSRRAMLARQVHTDLVRDALTARRRPLVRVLGMARGYRRPAYFDIAEPTLPDLPIASPAPALAPPPQRAVPVDV